MQHAAQRFECLEEIVPIEVQSVPLMISSSEQFMILNYSKVICSFSGGYLIRELRTVEEGASKLFNFHVIDPVWLEYKEAFE